MPLGPLLTPLSELGLVLMTTAEVQESKWKSARPLKVQAWNKHTVPSAPCSVAKPKVKGPCFSVICKTIFKNPHLKCSGLNTTSKCSDLKQWLFICSWFYSLGRDSQRWLVSLHGVSARLGISVMAFSFTFAISAGMAGNCWGLARNLCVGFPRGQTEPPQKITVLDFFMGSRFSLKAKWKADVFS